MAEKYEINRRASQINSCFHISHLVAELLRLRATEVTGEPGWGGFINQDKRCSVLKLFFVENSPRPLMCFSIICFLLPLLPTVTKTFSLPVFKGSACFRIHFSLQQIHQTKRHVLSLSQELHGMQRSTESETGTHAAPRLSAAEPDGGLETGAGDGGIKSASRRGPTSESSKQRSTVCKPSIR